MAGENEDLDNFLQEVDEISHIIKNLNSDDSIIRDKAICQADSRLNECGRIKYDRTVINHNAFKDDGPSPGISMPNLPPDDSRIQEIFMDQVEKDAKIRAKRRAQNECEAKIFKEKGNEEFKAGNYTEAIDLYTEAIHLVRDSTLLYTMRAEAYIKCHMYNEAIKDCDTIFIFNENNSKALLIKGKALYKVKQFNDAILLLEKAFKLYPLKRKLISGLIDDAKQSQERFKKEESVLDLFKAGNKNMINIENIVKKFQSGKMENEDYVFECFNLIELITNDNERIFFRTQNGFQCLYEHEKFPKTSIDENKELNQYEFEILEAAMDVFDVATKENEDNQNVVFNLNNFAELLQKILLIPHVNIMKTLNYLHSLSCEESGRKILVKNIDSNWLLKTLTSKTSREGGIGKISTNILNNMALNEIFRLKLESSFDKVLLPKYCNLLSQKNINATTVTYFGNLAMSENYRTKMAREEQFWISCILYLDKFNKSKEADNILVINAILGLIINLSKHSLPECIKPQMKPLIQQIVLLVTLKQLQIERIYIILSRIINSFEGAVKLVLNLNFLPHLLQLMEDEESSLTTHAVRILVSLTRISKRSQKEVAKKCMFLLKLLKSNDETTVGNAALCISNCLAVPKLSAYLTQTDVMDILLSIIKKEDVKDEVKKNAGLLLARLANAESEHLQQLRKLRGIEILHSCMSFQSL